jgi:hypothetical protein
MPERTTEELFLLDGVVPAGTNRDSPAPGKDWACFAGTLGNHQGGGVRGADQPEGRALQPLGHSNPVMPKVEPYYGEGYDRLAKDGLRCFFDLCVITLKTPSGQISILGSVQSNRATCYKTVTCKFK